jgi:hypothetical protein
MARLKQTPRLRYVDGSWRDSGNRTIAHGNFITDWFNVPSNAESCWLTFDSEPLPGERYMLVPLALHYVRYVDRRAIDFQIPRGVWRICTLVQDKLEHTRDKSWLTSNYPYLYGDFESTPIVLESMLAISVMRRIYYEWHRDTYDGSFVAFMTETDKLVYLGCEAE